MLLLLLRGLSPWLLPREGPGLGEMGGTESRGRGRGEVERGTRWSNRKKEKTTIIAFFSFHLFSLLFSFLSLHPPFQSLCAMLSSQSPTLTRAARGASSSSSLLLSTDSFFLLGAAAAVAAADAAAAAFGAAAGAAAARASSGTSSESESDIVAGG